MNKPFLLIGSILCLTSIIMGAFGAHLIENNFGQKAADIFDTAATYQMYHGLAIILIATIMTKINSGYFTKAIYFFLAGTICFSGSLYLLAFKAQLGSLTTIMISKLEAKTPPRIHTLLYRLLPCRRRHASASALFLNCHLYNFIA